MRAKWAMVIAAVCLMVTAAAIAYVVGQAKATAPKVVRAQRFELVDAQGRPRAMLGLGPDGSPALELTDEKRQVRAALSLAPAGGQPTLVLYDDNRKGRAALALTADGQPMLGLRDEKGDGRAVLIVLPDGRPLLGLYDENGKSRAALGATDLRDTRTGTAVKRPESSLVLFDPEGKIMWSAP